MKSAAPLFQPASEDLNSISEPLLKPFLVCIEMTNVRSTDCSLPVHAGTFLLSSDFPSPLLIVVAVTSI
ncbi:hypothetical protein [Nocardia sp. NPDC050175]|uniref:hypothetical protein n=1 Tax=Nocardia sp. NPDC050175 TaxID=3364317 RepID=UPI0037875458